jgi:hypothetical protein
LIKPIELPAEALLKQYQAQGAYTDCYSMDLPHAVSLHEYVEAFYTSTLFKVERVILSLLASKPADDVQAQKLALGLTKEFSAWTVEGRTTNQLLLCDFLNRTRSWLMCVPVDGSNAVTRLYFGSAVIPKRESRDGKKSFGIAFHALSAFHRVYTRALMKAARANLPKQPPSKIHFD